uniref:HNH endonuclease n=1 Tax=[Lactobacillus] rogosae TaxID=706562 RepID=UPI003FF015C7
MLMIENILSKVWDNQIYGMEMKMKIRKLRKYKSDKVNEIEKYTEELEGKEKEAVVKVRINQDKFREKLINKYKKCCLCNVNMNELLVASHIKPWSISDANEKLDIHNGLLMCPNHDKLFDRGYISFDDTGRILISEKLDDNNRMYMNITPTMKIDITEENIKYIKYHRKNVFIEK